MLYATSTSSPFGGGHRDSHAEPISVQTSKIEADVQRASDEATASEKRAKSDMEHEALLRLDAVKRANSAQTAEGEAREARASAEMLAESLRIQLAATVEKLEAKDSARARHQGSVTRYQKASRKHAQAGK
eukprot:g15328.t1